MKEFFYYKSPIGILEIITENEFLISLKITNDYKDNRESKISLNIKKQLDEYFSGKRTSFDIKISFSGTDFQKRVWMELLKIPYAKTKSYSNIAKNTGNKNSQRAVGNACNKNPIMIIIPCHRVINKNGNLSNFAYGQKIKKQLIELECNK